MKQLAVLILLLFSSPSSGQKLDLQLVSDSQGKDRYLKTFSVLRKLYPEILRLNQEILALPSSTEEYLKRGIGLSETENRKLIWNYPLGTRERKRPHFDTSFQSVFRDAFKELDKSFQVVLPYPSPYLLKFFKETQLVSMKSLSMEKTTILSDISLSEVSSLMLRKKLRGGETILIYPIERYRQFVTNSLKLKEVFFHWDPEVISDWEKKAEHCKFVTSFKKINGFWPDFHHAFLYYDFVLGILKKNIVLGQPKSFSYSIEGKLTGGFLLKSCS